MTDLFTMATVDPVAESTRQAVAAARRHLAGQFSYCAAATTHDEFEDRLLFIADRVEGTLARLASGDPTLFPVVHQALIESWHDDFAQIVEGRAREAQAAAAREAAQRKVAAWYLYGPESAGKPIAGPFETMGDAFAAAPEDADAADYYAQQDGESGKRWPLQAMRKRAAEGGIEYLRNVKSVTLKDGTEIPDVMGSDPDPSAPGGVKFVGYAIDGQRRTWTADDIAKVNDVEFTLRTDWVSERMEQQNSPREAKQDVRDFMATVRKRGSRKTAATVEYSATAPAHFIADFDKISKALADGGWVMEIDGEQFISPDAPEDLVRMHHNLTQMGYANGHFASLKTADFRVVDESTGHIAEQGYKTREEAEQQNYGEGFSVHYVNPEEAKEQNDGVDKVMASLPRTAATQSEADAIVANVPEQYRERFEKLKHYMVYGPGYDRIVTEHLFDAARHLPHGAASYGEIYLAKAESVAHYRETGVWIDPFTGQAELGVTGKRVARLAWRHERQMMQTYPGLSESVGVWLVEHNDRTGAVVSAPEGQYMWSAEGVDGDVEGTAETLQEAQDATEAALTAESANQLAMFGAHNHSHASVPANQPPHLHATTGSSAGGMVQVLYQNRPVQSSDNLARHAGGTPPWVKDKDDSKDEGDSGDSKDDSTDSADAEASGDEKDGDETSQTSSDVPGEEPAQKLPSADPSTMDVGQSSLMTYTLSDGTTGEIEVTFVREENGVFFFNGPTGEFGVGNQQGKWQDAQGATFSFASAAAGNDEPDDPTTTNKSEPEQSDQDDGAEKDDDEAERFKK